MRICRVDPRVKREPLYTKLDEPEREEEIICNGRRFLFKAIKKGRKA